MSTNEKIYYPMLAKDQHQTSSSVVDPWGVFDTLPQRAQDLLTAEQTVGLIKSFCEQANLQQSSIAKFSIFVRQLLFGEIDNNTFITQAGQTLNIQLSTVEAFTKSLFTLDLPHVSINTNSVSMDYALADAQTIAQHITAQDMEDQNAQSSLLQRLQSPHFANELLSIVATHYYPKLELVHHQYVKANELK